MISTCCKHVLAFQDLKSCVWTITEEIPFNKSHVSLPTDVTEIHARLFDHRPVLQGEISYFVKQFEVTAYIFMNLSILVGYTDVRAGMYVSFFNVLISS